MEYSQLDLARLAAIKAYAELENELCLLLKRAMAVEAEVASAIFYQISNTRTRYAIIGSILDISHRETWARAWGRIERWLGPCDTARNHIIHWGEESHLVLKMDGKTSEIVEQHVVDELTNSVRKWRMRGDSPRAKYNVNAIYEARDQMRVMTHIVSRFSNTIDKPERWPWRDIFQQPIGDRKPVEFLQHLNERGIPARLPPYDR
ncbi:MAG: hypothetical protein VX569_12905 [Pseudomonadota bacterium]|nr:hypothetical protein [Pseudomonadota bacterium]